MIGGTLSLRLRAMAVEPGTRSYGAKLRVRLFPMRGKVQFFDHMVTQPRPCYGGIDGTNGSNEMLSNPFPNQLNATSSSVSHHSSNVNPLPSDVVLLREQETRRQTSSERSDYPLNNQRPSIGRLIESAEERHHCETDSSSLTTVPIPIPPHPPLLTDVNEESGDGEEHEIDSSASDQHPNITINDDKEDRSDDSSGESNIDNKGEDSSGGNGNSEPERGNGSSKNRSC